MFSLNLANSVTKKYLSFKVLEISTSCVRDRGATTAPARFYVRDRIFKLSPIHASVIY